MDIKLDHLLIDDPSTSQTCGEVIIEQSNEAYFVLIIEIDSNQPQDRLLLDSLVGQILDTYKSYAYQYTDRLLERMLEDLNATIPNIISGQRSGHKVQCLLAVSQNKTLQLAVWGRMKAYILRNNSLTNIISSTENSKERISIFTSIIEGEIKESDKIILSTENLFNYLAKDKIKKVVESLPPVSAVGHLQNILENVPKEKSFFSVLLEVVSTKPSATINLIHTQVQKSSKDSIQNLVTKQSSTQNILKPSVSFLVTDRIKNSFRIAKASFVFVKEILGFVVDGVKNLSQLIKPRLWLKQIIEFWFQLKSWYLKLNSKQKKIFWVVLTIIILLGQNILLKQQRQARLQTQAEIKNQISTLYIIASEVESKLMYDTSAAQVKLNEFQDKINNLKLLAKDSKTLAEAEQLYNNLYQKVWHINQASNLTKLGTNNGYSQLALDSDNNLVLISSSNLAVLNVNNKQLSEQRLISDKTASTLVYLDNLKANLVINTDLSALTYSGGKIQTIQQLAGPEIKNFSAITNFQSRIYVLDKLQNKIIRLLLTKSSLQSPQTWVSDTNLISQVQDLTINDSQLYLLSTDSIIKISRGKVAGQTKILVNKPLATKLKIFSQNNFRNLYILDPDNQRLIVLNKKLETIAQVILAPNLKLLDFKVDETKKKIYLLTDTEILSQDYKY